MRSAIRRTVWLLSGVFVLLAAWLVASTVNVLVESALAPPIAGEQAPLHPARVAKKDVGPSPDGPLLARLTGLTFEKPGVEVSGPPVGTAPGDALPRSTLPVRLLGTLVAQDAQWSLASLQEQSSARARSIMVGDDLMGARVVAIERERIIVLSDGRESYVDGTALGAPVTPPETALSRTVHGAATPSGSTLGRGIRAVSDNAYEIPRSDLQEAMDRLNDVATEARMMPAFQNGQSVGFKVMAIRPGSFFTRLGLQNGDVLKRINGLDMNSPDKLLEMYAKLKDSTHIELELDRNGTTTRKVYDVR